VRRAHVGYNPPVSGWAGADLVGEGTPEERLAYALDAVRELSHLFDPQGMVDRYAERMQSLFPVQRIFTLTRRGLAAPHFGVLEARSWEESAAMRRDTSLFIEQSGGLLAELVHAGAPRIVGELDLAADDPARAFLAGQRSLVSIPVFEQGEAMEAVVQTRAQARAFSRERLPDMVWLTNLFARTAFYARRMSDLDRTNAKLTRDLAYIADLQRALLPKSLPRIDGVRIEVRSEPAESSGGDYYDFFPLPNGRWGFLLADVSGHGTATAVLMAITHAIAHLFPRADARSGPRLRFLNRHLARRYTAGTDAFVTAFHGVYDPPARTLDYALAGHLPPLVLRAKGAVEPLEATAGPPLGVVADAKYADRRIRLDEGDRLLLFTDGVTETRNEEDDLFGDRIDDVVRTSRGELGVFLDRVAGAARAFAGRRPRDDDWTLIGLEF